MKRAIFTSLLIVLVMSSVSFAAELTDKKMTVGLDAPLVGWNNPNWVDKQNGEIISTLGFNYGLGISYRRYFEPVRTNQFNNFWGAGTVAILFPYLGIGTSYVWDSGFYAGVGLIWIVPEIHAGFMF
jgi:hypothetical protein